MAVDFKGVSTSNLSALKKPAGFLNPEVDIVPDAPWVWEEEIEIDRSTVYNSNRKTTLENILNDNTVGLNVQCQAVVEQLEHTVNDVEAYAELMDLNSNLRSDDLASDFYTDQDDKYVAKVIIYAKVISGGGE